MATSKLTIAFVFDDSLDRTDGVQQYITALGTWLHAQGHHVHYIVGETNTTPSVAGTIHSVGRNVGVRFNQNRLSVPLPLSDVKVRAVLGKIQPDLLHVQLPYSPMMAGRFVKVAQATDIPAIGTFHILPAGRLQTLGTKLLGSWQRKQLKRFDQLLAVSEAAAVFARRSYADRELAVLPNVVDLKRYQPSSKAPTTRTLVFLGRLVERKGPQYLIPMFDYLKKLDGNQDLSLVIGGGGPLRERLEKQRASSPNSSDIKLTGFVDESKKAELFHSATLALLPSTGGESFGIILLEAMASASGPTLGGRNPGYETVINDHQSELLISDPSNAATFAEQVNRLLHDEQHCRELVGWQWLRANQFDVELVGPRLLSYYYQLLR